MGMPFDKIIEKIVALGVPGLVLVIVIATVGEVGGAAIVVALATLGGPLGMLGGIAVLGLIVLISQAIAKYGAEVIMKSVVKGLKDKGMTTEEIVKAVNGYWFISNDLKQKIIASILEGENP